MEHFNPRAVANMEVALERANRLLKKESEQHEYRPSCPSHQRIPEIDARGPRDILPDRSPNGFRHLSGTIHSWTIFLLCPVVDVPSANYRVSRQGTDS